jgi:hypothetical protein
VRRLKQLSVGEKRLPTGCHVVKDETDCVLGHGESLDLVSAISDDLPKRRNTNGEAALFFGLDHDS